MPGQLLPLDVTNIAHGGISVARHEGRVVFVADAIPGERVLARVSDDRKPRFWRAETVSVEQPSPHRRPHVWESAALERDPDQRAGGAEFGHIDLPHQRELKRQVLVDALRRMARLPDGDPLLSDDGPGAVRVEPAGDDEARGGLGWRTRVRLQVDAEGRPGPFAARSHRVIPVPDLPLAVPELAAAAPLELRFPGERTVDVLLPQAGSPGSPGPRLVIGDQAPSTIVEVVGDREFRLADRGFWQVHRDAAITLTAAVQYAVDADRFDPQAANLDLYGGVGLFAAALGDRFERVRVTSVESDPAATEFAAGNLAEWVGARAETGRVERWIRTLVESASAGERERLSRATVVLDPPRSGAGREVVDALAELAVAQVVYVACDPVAFARDVGWFGEHGYRLTALRAFDLFPHTHHLEAVGTLVRS